MNLARHAWLGLLLLATGSAGCNLVTPLALITEDPKETVAAEFDKLAGKRAVILVWAESDTLFEYPHVRLETATYLGEHLKAHVPDVKFTPARRVEEYLQKQTSPTPDPLAAGREFGADIVISVSMLEFTMRDREMAQFYRGRARASTTVYDLKDKSGTPQRYALTDVLVVYPQDRPIGFDNTAATVVRQKTYEMLAELIGRKFYSYDKPK